MKNILIIFSIIFSISSFGQNVGIGVPAPVEKLEVAGNTKADGFKYNAPKTFYYAIPDAAFSARSGSETVQKTFSSGGAFISNGTTGYGLTAPIHLPHGAKVISITAEMYDASATQDLSCNFDEQFTTGFVAVTTLQTSGSTGFTSQSVTLTPSKVIDNINRAYELIVYPTSGNWTSFDLMIKRVVITYTVTETQ
jgi:hypothetical protein